MSKLTTVRLTAVSLAAFILLLLGFSINHGSPEEIGETAGILFLAILLVLYVC